MNHDVTTATKLDTHQRLALVSVSWEEEIPFVEQGMIALATAGLVFGLMFVFLVPGWGFMLLLGGALAFALAFFYPGIPRQVTFAADGSIRTPYGYAYRGGDQSIAGDHRYITSIESRPMRESKLFEVIVTTEYGALFPLSTNLPEQVAFKVAVLLTRNLRDLRAAQAARLADDAGGTPMPEWGEARAVLS